MSFASLLSGRKVFMIEVMNGRERREEKHEVRPLR